jgi:hypothetical protein
MGRRTHPRTAHRCRPVPSEKEQHKKTRGVVRDQLPKFPICPVCAGVEMLHMCGRITRPEPDAQPERMRTPGKESVDEMCRGLLPANSPTFRERWAARRGGGPADWFGLRPFVHVKAVAVVQHGSLARDTWEGEKEDDWVGSECCEYSECPEWGNVFCAQGCREFEGAPLVVWMNSEIQQYYVRIAVGKGCADADGVCAKTDIER